MYLANNQTADDLIDKFREIKIKEKVLPIQPLITRNKRIVLSNVCPVIPYYVLEEKLTELNVRPLSPITFLRLGLSDTGVNHILSFRRQVYIHLDDADKLPNAFQVTYNDTPYWIFL